MGKKLPNCKLSSITRIYMYSCEFIRDEPFGKYNIIYLTSTVDLFRCVKKDPSPSGFCWENTAVKRRVSDIKKWLMTVWAGVFLINQHTRILPLPHTQTQVDELFIGSHQHACDDRDAPTANTAACFWSRHPFNNAMLINVADWEAAIFPRTYSLHLPIPSTLLSFKAAVSRGFLLTRFIPYFICVFKRVFVGERRKKLLKNGGKWGKNIHL